MDRSTLTTLETGLKGYYKMPPFVVEEIAVSYTQKACLTYQIYLIT